VDDDGLLDLFDRIVGPLLRRRAPAVARRLGPGTGADDVAQEVTRRVFARLRRDRGGEAHLRSFLAVAAASALASVARDGTAAKRDPRRRAPLAAAGGLAAPGGDPDLALDVAAVLAGASAEERAVAEGLLRGLNRAALARELGVSRTTVHKRCRRLRQRFERAGFRDYL
jgi:DNA-directed RNA polymerase specialized sigma24 family protein